MAATRKLEMAEFKSLIEAYERSRNRFFTRHSADNIAKKSKLLCDLTKDLENFISPCISSDTKLTIDRMLVKLIDYALRAYELNGDGLSNIHDLLTSIFNKLVQFLVDGLHENDTAYINAAKNFLDILVTEKITRKTYEGKGSFILGDLFNVYHRIIEAYPAHLDDRYHSFHLQRSDLALRLHKYMVQAYNTVAYSKASLGLPFAFSMLQLMEITTPKTERRFLPINPLLAFTAEIKLIYAEQILIALIDKFKLIDNFIPTALTLEIAVRRTQIAYEQSYPDKTSILFNIMEDVCKLAKKFADPNEVCEARFHPLQLDRPNDDDPDAMPMRDLSTTSPSRKPPRS